MSPCTRVTKSTDLILVLDQDFKSKRTIFTKIEILFSWDKRVASYLNNCIKIIKTKSINIPICLYDHQIFQTLASHYTQRHYSRHLYQHDTIANFSYLLGTEFPALEPSSTASLPLHIMSRWRVNHLPHHLYICISFTCLHILVQIYKTITFLCSRKKKKISDCWEARKQKIDTQMVKILPLALCLRFEAAFARISLVRRKNEFLISIEVNHDFFLSIFLELNCVSVLCDLYSHSLRLDATRMKWHYSKTKRWEASNKKATTIKETETFENLDFALCEFVIGK